VQQRNERLRVRQSRQTPERRHLLGRQATVGLAGGALKEAS
jgi:hypothetical protein